MSRSTSSGSTVSDSRSSRRPPDRELLRRVLAELPPERLPFSPSDISAGSECELQAAVAGTPQSVDLALAIEQSNYFKNIYKRAASGESPRRVVTQLEAFLSRAPQRVWENSWVRFPLALLGPFASTVLRRDLRADHRTASGPERGDRQRFLFTHEGEEWLRVPISYLLKLALADSVTVDRETPPALRELAGALMTHFVNDNTSPETHSFHIVSLSPASGMGRGIAGETAKRYLLTQLLIMYANARFELARTGQHALAYFSAHAPIQQQELNALISDSFYRELFMNPCLSGWDEGEAKHRYMALCHETLSRSQLNAVIRLKDAGIITRNLVVLPRTSSTSLANNGTHLSLGSRSLTALLRDGDPRFDACAEKYVGDLVIKIVEHCLPLFVGTYSAAPYRLDFWDFHPERALGFLPHELDAMHLRMLWRRWKKKAGLKILGRPVTPVGPLWFDRPFSRLFGLRGDLVPDFRLVDYLMALTSTDQSPALDGTLDNHERLKRDLAQMGVFHESMSVYLPYKLRTFAAMGFSGFEGRYYSLFESLMSDFAEAADLQALVTALAFKYVRDGSVTHADIPDDVATESERRQIFFCAAIDLKAFNVRHDSPNRFLMKVLSKTRHTRDSRRYAGQLRVRTADYRAALLETLTEDAADLIEAMGMQETIRSLHERLSDRTTSSASRKLTAGILGERDARSAMRLSGEDFNRAAETYYQTTLRRHHVREALELLEADLLQVDQQGSPLDEACRRLATAVIGVERVAEWLHARKEDLIGETAERRTVQQCIHLALISVYRDRARTAEPAQRFDGHHDASPVY